MTARVARARAGAEGVAAALVVLVLVNLVWGGSLPATKLGLTEFGPFTLAWVRLTVSSVLFLLVLLLRGEVRGLGWRQWLRLGLLGVLGYSGTIGLQTVGTVGTSGAVAAVLGSTGPFFITLFAPLLLGERLDWTRVAGLLLAMTGVALVLGLDPRAPDQLPAEAWLGSGLVLLSSACFAVYSVLGKATAHRHSPLVISGVTCLGGTLGLALPAAWELALAPPQPTLLGWGVIAFLSVGVSFVGMLAWFWALRLVPTARGGAFLFLQPVSGVVLASLVLGDRLSEGFVLGTVLVLAGLALTSSR